MPYGFSDDFGCVQGLQPNHLELVGGCVANAHCVYGSDVIVTYCNGGIDCNVGKAQRMDTLGIISDLLFGVAAGVLTFAVGRFIECRKNKD